MLTSAPVSKRQANYRPGRPVHMHTWMGAQMLQMYMSSLRVPNPYFYFLVLTLIFIYSYYFILTRSGRKDYPDPIMGFLGIATPMTWEESQKWLKYIREHGVAQFVAQFNKNKVYCLVFRSNSLFLTIEINLDDGHQ